MSVNDELGMIRQ